MNDSSTSTGSGRPSETAVYNDFTGQWTDPVEEEKRRRLAPDQPYMRHASLFPPFEDFENATLDQYVALMRDIERSWHEVQYDADSTTNLNRYIAWTEGTYRPPSTWEPVDLGPYLDGEIAQDEAILGMPRSDGVRLIYPGREHAILGDTESGKTWFALGCAVTELMYESPVVYIHYEEPDAASTIERLLLLGVPKDLVKANFHFIAPQQPVDLEWLTRYIDLKPDLVIHDGVNEAMMLHQHKLDVEGWSDFRRRLVIPFTKAGIATLACDHLPMVRDSSRRDAIGTVHKGNVLDGARIQLENEKPFGRGKRGVSHVFITKDRPGYLRSHGRPTKTPGRTFMGTLVVDNEDSFEPLGMVFYAPRDDEETEIETVDPASELAFMVWRVVYEQPGHCVESVRALFAVMRAAGEQVRDNDIRDSLDDLTVSGRLQRVQGKRNATGYRVRLLCGPRPKLSGALAAFDSWSASQDGEDQ